MGNADSAVSLTVWMDYACPFCKKLYQTWREEVIPRYHDDVQFVFMHQIQPWHPQSVLMAEASMAAWKVGGMESFLDYSDVLYEHQTDFFDANIWELSRKEITERLILLHPSKSIQKEMEELLAFRKIEGMLNTGTQMTDDMKLYIKLGRQTGIHVSPTTCLNGIVVDTSSSWKLKEWSEFLDHYIKVSATA